MQIKCYAAFNKDTDVRLKSSSGGIFHTLAKRIINEGGVVFGAAFNKKWMVEMIYIDSMSDIGKLMQSKYSQADLKNTLKEAEAFLKNNRQVLYVGTPCQIFALKKYLKKDYENLLTVDLVCHGVMPAKIWKDYLKTIKRFGHRITNINFRDKTKRPDGGGGWHDFNFRVDYSDGKSLLEPHNDNEYMKAFLGDHYLKESCYNCKFKNENSSADITIGDFWSVDKNNSDLNDEKGISIVLLFSKKGENFFKKNEDIVCREISYEDVLFCGGGVLSNIPKIKRLYYKNIFKKKRKTVGIISLPFDMNCGGAIESYALQEVVAKLGYNPITINATKVNEHLYLRFVDDYMYIKSLTIPDSGRYQEINYHDLSKDEFDAFIIGSDQIWRSEWINADEIFLTFTKDWPITRIAYAPSLGSDTWSFNAEDTKTIKTMLTQYFSGVSVREIDSIKLFEENIGLRPKLALDPVLLLNSKHYLDMCRHIKTKKGFLSYILDSNNIKSEVISNVAAFTNSSAISYNKKNVLEWLAAFRDAEFVITDSYHGCLLSIIFNKPFLAFFNKNRGNSRFNTLIKLFNIKNRFIDGNFGIDYNLLSKPVRIPYSVKLLRYKNLRFLRKTLKINDESLLNRMIKFCKRCLKFMLKKLKLLK